MAFKSEAQTLALMQEFGELEEVVRTACGTVATQVDSARDQVTVADPTPEQAAQDAALNGVLQALGSLYRATVAAGFTIHPSLGRLASSQDLSDPATNLAALNDYLQTNSREFESRGLTKNAWAAGGSNVGSGTVLELTTDPLTDTADIAHVGTLQLLCRRDSQMPGVVSGNEAFNIYATKAADFPWQEGGAGSAGQGYAYKYGRGTNEYGTGYESINTGQELLAVSGGNTGANLFVNGDFEAALVGSGDDKIVGSGNADNDGISGTASHFSLVSTAATGLIKGSYSLKNATGNDVLRYYISSGLKPKVPYGLTVLTYKPDDGSAGTITGTMTLVIKDDSTTHVTLSFFLGSDALATITRHSTTFIAPSNVGKNLRMEITFPTYGGTSTGKAVIIDELVLTELRQLDGGRAIALVSGATDFRYNDVFTASTTDAANGKLQFFSNLVFGRYFKNDPTPATWVDW